MSEEGAKAKRQAERNERSRKGNAVGRVVCSAGGGLRRASPDLSGFAVDRSKRDGRFAAGLRKRSEAKSSVLLNEGFWHLILKRNHLQKKHVPHKLGQRIGLFPVDNGALDYFRGLFVFSRFLCFEV